MRRNTRHGFTLIELLIVVAIIAILAAIAIPNFLMAQVRAKVSRAMAEERSMATALESYYVDQNTYPTDQNPPWNGIYGASITLKVLTTPVSYMSSIPQAPFGPSSYGNPLQWPDHYTYLYMAEEVTINWYIANIFGGNAVTAYASLGLPYGTKWSLTSPGPALSAINWNPPYDPSNGTVSNGCILRTGP